jgi:hypothetical protein
MKRTSRWRKLASSFSSAAPAAGVCHQQSHLLRRMLKNRPLRPCRSLAPALLLPGLLLPSSLRRCCLLPVPLPSASSQLAAMTQESSRTVNKPLPAYILVLL